jgi:GT2 family glycosyltransferase
VNPKRQAARLICRQLRRIACRYPRARRLARLLPKADRQQVEIIWRLRGSPLLDQTWYLEQHPQLRTKGKDPVLHYVRSGVKKGFNPNPLFDTEWYLAQHADVRASAINPLWHYITFGAAELRNPHRRFDAQFYVEQHPEAARNPLEHYLTCGREQGWPTRACADVADYLPLPQEVSVRCPVGIKVDVIVPVYRGFDETCRCLRSVLDDPDRTFNRLIVIDDCSPEPRLSAWLRQLAENGSIELWRNDRNLGFVRSANRGMSAASPDADVLLLNSDTEVPRAWLQRLITQAYKAERIGSVTPFSNNASICGYPSMSGARRLPFGFSLAAVDQAFRQANAGRSVDIPTAIGFCMYIRRDCLEETGLFDAERFGRGYGEESDFCLRASAKGWRHLLACNTFVYHAGEVSFGADAPERSESWGLLTGRYPHYGSLLAKFVRRDPAAPFRFAATVELFRSASRPKILLISQDMGGGIERDVPDLSRTADALFLKLAPRGRDVELTVLDHTKDLLLALPLEETIDLLDVLKKFGVSRVHIHNVIEIESKVRELVHQLRVPLDFTAHGCLPILSTDQVLNEQTRC